MKNLKKLFIVAFFATCAAFPMTSTSQSLGGIGAGSGEEKCSIKVLGIDTPCTRVWCSSTMAMTGCGAGDINSQTCSKAKNC